MESLVTIAFVLQCFFISKTDFKKTGGFDEGYDGFGLNDEDFLPIAVHWVFH